MTISTFNINIDGEKYQGKVAHIPATAFVYGNVDLLLQRKGLYNLHPGENPQGMAWEKAVAYRAFMHSLVMTGSFCWHELSSGREIPMPQALSKLMRNSTLEIMANAALAANPNIAEIYLFEPLILRYVKEAAAIASADVARGAFISGLPHSVIELYIKGQVTPYETIELDITDALIGIEWSTKHLVKVHSALCMFKLIVGLSSPPISQETIVI